MKLGEINNLKAFRQTDNGWYLIDEEGEEVLLPNKYVPETLRAYNMIDVFIHRDGEDRITAITEKPYNMLGEFALLDVKHVTDYGVFVDWGIDKDLLVPFAEQYDHLEEGKAYIIYCMIDEKTDRLVGTCRYAKYFEKENIDLEINQEVDLIIDISTDLGRKVIVNGKYGGLVFRNEIFKDIEYGDEIKGYVKNIREDGKLDISLRKVGFKAHNEDASAMILRLLEENGGELPFNDKSAPDAIKAKFGLSKKAFKRAVGGLYKSKKIVISQEGISLT